MTFKQRLALLYFRTKFYLLSLISKKKAASEAIDLFITPQRRTIKPLPTIFNDAEKLTFELEGVPIRGYSWNRPKGKKILIIHGFESSIVNFDRYIEPLLNKGYEVLAFDAPGHGGSDGNKITAPMFAKMITTISEKFGPIHSYIAHSFGGLALSIALENIEHDHTFKVVFIAPATETKTAIDQFFHIIKLNRAVRAEFDKLITRIGGHPAAWYSVHRAIKNCKAAILWVHDEDDEQTPISDALKVKDDNLPNVTFLITKGLGHRKIYRDRKVLEKIIEFL
ncbi:MAG TPA: alpha/beta fold hydrolase [Chitinophagaceae bacterium]|nr:alpha/beta fold hydrolase [Chitinophagaceae bacterium]